MDQDVLDEVVRRIVEVASPEKIILFGSRARGAARGDSDLDLLVVKPSDEPRFRRAAPLYLALRDIDLPIDILVYTPEEIEEWRAVRQAFVTTALREKTVVYEREERAA